MPFKLSNLNSNLTLTLGYLNPALNNSALEYSWCLEQAKWDFNLVKRAVCSESILWCFEKL